MAAGDDRPDLGLIDEPPQLIGRKLGAISGFGDTGLGQQVVEGDGDHYRCWHSTDRGQVAAFQEFAAGFVEGVVESLHGGPLIGQLRGGAVGVVITAAARFGQRLQDRIQLGAQRGGEPASQMPHAVPPLLQLQVTPVLLQSVVDGLGPVEFGGIDHGAGEPSQLGWPEDRRMLSQQLLGGVHCLRIQIWP